MFWKVYACWTVLGRAVKCWNYFRFVNIEQRMEVWSKRPLAKKNNLYMEEWLTGI